MSDPNHTPSSPTPNSLPVTRSSGAWIEPFKENSPELGADVFIHPSAAVIGRIYLGDRVNIWPQVTLRGDEGDIRIGADTNIQDGTTIHMTGGYSETMIGERVTVGHMCLLHGCKIGDDCLIGMGTLLLDRCEIGAGSYIAAGTMITGGKVIPPNSFVMGRPGSLKITPISDLRAQEKAYSWRHYVTLAQEYLTRGSGSALSLMLIIFTLSVMSSSLSGCTISERPYQSSQHLVHQHHITFATLKQQNLYDYSLFADTELDLFSHRREIITLTRQQPLTINYRSFSSPRVDYLIERAQSLYAQYRFASNAIERFRAELVDLYGDRILKMNFDELQVILSQDNDEGAEVSMRDTQVSAGKIQTTSVATETAQAQESAEQTSGDQASQEDKESKTVEADPDKVTDVDTASTADELNPKRDQESSTPLLSSKLIQGAKAVRLSIAGHQDLVARAVRAQLELDRWREAAESDLSLDLNLINVRPSMAREVERARLSLDALMSGAPLLSRSMSEVSAAAAAIR
jgi:carbonic anhydrase/acetyltransferase-like protein (isoleucine patch superfamily)